MDNSLLSTLVAAVLVCLTGSVVSGKSLKAPPGLFKNLNDQPHNYNGSKTDLTNKNDVICNCFHTCPAHLINQHRRLGRASDCRPGRGLELLAQGVALLFQMRGSLRCLFRCFRRRQQRRFMLFELLPVLSRSL